MARSKIVGTTLNNALILSGTMSGMQHFEIQRIICARRQDCLGKTSKIIWLKPNLPYHDSSSNIIKPP